MRRMRHIAPPSIRVMHAIIAAAVILLPATAVAQYNCSIYKDSNYARACRIYNYAGDSLFQGSAKCEQWLGRVYLATGQRALAKKMFLHAKELMNDHSGKYHLHAPYCEKVDAIYESDIDAALADL
jgi:hypothetical protein